jgi:predicted kinase
MPPTHQPRLIVFGGLPGTGKTTISRALAKKLAAFYLRIDRIEQAANSVGVEKIGSAGYVVANALAEDNLKLGFSVIADCVNPVAASRQAWRDIAARSSARLTEIYLLCSDKAEHRRRVERRQPDISGHLLPDWEAVIQHEFQPWDDNHQLVLDTASLSVVELVGRSEAYVLGRDTQG